MLMTKAYIYGLISADATLLAMLGDNTHIIDAWPEMVTLFPLVILQDDNQSDGEFADNQPTMSKVRTRIDIFSQIDDTYDNEDIGKEIARIFKTVYFTCGSNGEVQDPTPGVRHRVMRFSRELFTSDII